MSKATAEAIGRTLGLVEYIDESNSGDCRGKCIRIRINLDITQPLCCGRMVNLGGPKPQWISFQYERMPIFCYWCGTLNYDEKDCPIWLWSKGSLRREGQPITNRGDQSARNKPPPQQPTSTVRLTVLDAEEEHEMEENEENLNPPTGETVEVHSIPTKLCSL